MESLRLLFSTTPRHTAKYLTISCATIPPILMPIIWRSLLFVHPRWLHTSRVSFASSDVEYRMIGLSLSPIPLLSKIRQEYFSGCAWPKSFNWRCQYHLKPPNPVIHYQAQDMSHDSTLGCLTQLHYPETRTVDLLQDVWVHCHELHKQY